MSSVLRNGVAFFTLLSACAPTTTNFTAAEPISIYSSPLEERVPVQYKEGVQRVLDVRQFAIDYLGFHKNSKHYTWFTEEQNHQHTLAILAITEKTILPTSREAKVVKLQLNGLFMEDITGFLYIDSVKDDLTDERDYYKNKGYDTYWRAVTSYHSYGQGLGSPITPDFLQLDPIDQGETTVHEMCHESVEHTIGSELTDEVEESYCTLVGHAAVIDYFSQKKMDDEHMKAEESFARHATFAQKFKGVYGKLTELYRQDIPVEEKVKQREQLFAEIQPFMSMETNNASLWSWHPYLAHHSLMHEAYTSQGSIQDFVQKMKDCPSEEEKALEYIRSLRK